VLVLDGPVQQFHGRRPVLSGSSASVCVAAREGQARGAFVGWTSFSPKIGLFSPYLFRAHLFLENEAELWPLALPRPETCRNAPTIEPNTTTINVLITTTTLYLRGHKEE
jgi:hypothetical protein